MSDVAARSAKKEKIVIIEGDVALGRRLFSTLRDDGYGDVSVFNDGIEGLKGIYDVLPHLVLLDITLSGMNGYEVLSKKAAEPLLSKIPLFLLSTQAVPVNIRNIPQGSVTEFVMALNANPIEILGKINAHFGYESRKEKEKSVAKKKMILWVEDDKLIGTILEKKLLSSGFDLIHAKNGEEAMNTLKNTIPDVVVVDLLLPGMSGFDILQGMGADDRLKPVPKMVLSNLSKSSDIERARVLGANKFLVKASTSLDQIVSEIRQMCGLRG